MLTCLLCKKNPPAISGKNKDGSTRYKRRCEACVKRSRAIRLNGHRREMLRHKKMYCESCGFVAKNACQLDVDHKDGNRENQLPENLQTLCANCHRLKTHLNGDHKQWAKGVPSEGNLSLFSKYLPA